MNTSFDAYEPGSREIARINFRSSVQYARMLGGDEWTPEDQGYLIDAWLCVREDADIYLYGRVVLPTI